MSARIRTLQRCQRTIQYYVDVKSFDPLNLHHELSPRLIAPGSDAEVAGHRNLPEPVGGGEHS